MDDSEPEAKTQQEVKEEAASEEDDPVTSREELEVGLMDQGDSDAGEEIGQETP
ncbi:MAG: hypothetical protein ACR2MO_15325 [Acidimicrobiales bacterium]